jgi:hypothetical protein
MSLYLSPTFYGIEDHVAPHISKPFAVRVYYPTDDDVLLGAPLLSGPHPLVIFAHGQRSSFTMPKMCPEEFTRDHRRWGVVLGGIARSGYVVAVPDLSDLFSSGVESVVPRIDQTIDWMRTQWHGRRTILTKPVIEGRAISQVPSQAADLDAPPSDVQEVKIAARVHIPPPVFPGNPTPLALVGHSWGTRAVCTYAAAHSGVAAAVTIAATFDDNTSAPNIIGAGIPTLMICGKAAEESMNFAPMDSIWPELATPKYQTAFQGVGHWDWFGRFGAIRRCDGTPPTWRDTGHIAGELIAGFLARHVARVAFPPPDLVPIPLLRPNHLRWYDPGSAIQMRWDAPGENFDTLPSTGDGILGPWTETPPW